jgi:hypothetical protein
MRQDYDNYEVYYADKLWNLLPAVYRSQDTDLFDKPGPLREMVNRIGVQAAIVRRSIDRLWEDQSIETCDDWVIAYIGDLLATNLIASLDARGQRLDVAKTIYYRRRKGTVAILEEIAQDITGWNARVVEFFRRLGRTRHNLDPAIGLPADTLDPDGNRKLQQAQGLVGSLTQTPIGGWADLRNVYGAAKAHSAFDEFFYTADFRRGRGQVGWHNIPRLGVFLWRLYSFPAGEPINSSLAQTLPNKGIGVTPVNYLNCKGHYSFDPTGREIPLFADASRPFGDNWVSPAEWQLPVEISKALLEHELSQISKALLEHELSHLYATEQNDSISFNSLGIFDLQGNLWPVGEITADSRNWNAPTNPRQNEFAFLIDPTKGKLIAGGKAPKATDEKVLVTVTYHYGFSSTIGAGSYDRRIFRQPPTSMPNPQREAIAGGDQLAAPLATLAPTGTLTILDSLTYTKVSNVAGIEKVTLRAENKTRPLIRLPKPVPNVGVWVFDGANDSSELVLEGLFVSGGDIVLRGKFKSVILNCCTFDPGEAGDSPATYAKAVDGRDLIPCHLWIEGQIHQLTLDRCIVGPIRTRAKGKIEHLKVTDSIVQAIRTNDFGLFNLKDIKDPTLLAVKLKYARDPLSRYLQGQFTAATQQMLNEYNSANPPLPALEQALVSDLNALLAGSSLYDEQRFKQVRLTAATLKLVSENPQGADLIRLNRLLLEEAYPQELADQALALNSGEVNLKRCTILGSAIVHQLEASECILDDVIQVDNSQQGCVRFSAWATGSTLPKPYESVEILPKSPLFTTHRFGQPGYGQLQLGADTAILTAKEGKTITAGAQDGSEMGAFAREKHPIKERSLRIKYEEYMPLGLIPVIIYAS